MKFKNILDLNSENNAQEMLEKEFVDQEDKFNASEKDKILKEHAAEIESFKETLGKKRSSF